MVKKNLIIQGIPSNLWGEPSDKLFIAVHGNMSRKDDDEIVVFAEEAIDRGYQVISFDFPEQSWYLKCNGILKEEWEILQLLS